MRPIPEITDVEIAFPANVIGKFLPNTNEIPVEFQNYSTDPLAKKWIKVMEDWFYFGLKNVKWIPKSGVDPKLALRVIKACMGSYEPKHEHKTAGVAFLLSEWFEDITYEKGK